MSVRQKSVNLFSGLLVVFALFSIVLVLGGIAGAIDKYLADVWLVVYLAFVSIAPWAYLIGDLIQNS